ncbi:unnamed protein product [Chondrus crispus]|uniref:OTU domain-containing protein n=1 Tax=Chondrus crispus TaxID=2769 RepID=R7QIQ0_CHOCR|nr:unnamed protein product [Chondrus crispus]CDF37623.1 unnamed protein product [Chondrus crispus]|eukprot:XP_005717494.1 unnamed protein product [Chondrus crispus]
MFRRRPTNLAATAAHTAARGYPNNAAAPITSQAEFRRNFLKVHKDRVIRDNNGTCFRLHPIVMNGDCGFGAIAKGINVARERVRDMAPQPPEPPHDPHFPIQQRSQTQNQPQHNNRNKHFSFAHDRKRWRRIRSRPWIWHRLVARRAQDRPTKSLQAKDLRKAMFDELKKARKTYLDECEDLSGIYTNDDFDTLEREVSHPGIAGHWLGTVLGVLEHVIVAQAMNIDIYLYQFDLQRQCIRQFESATVENPDCEVYLFFTGPAACGHFDTLVKISNTRDNLFMA